MKKFYLFISFFLIFFISYASENSTYKINEAEIDLLFEQSDEIDISGVFAQKIFIDNYTGRFANGDDDKKIIAGVLALTFLGAFGVHRYYLGHTKAGVIGYLLPSICFGAGWIPAIIDGVLHLTSTDEEFNKKYRDNQKIWVWL